MIRIVPLVEEERMLSPDIVFDGEAGDFAPAEADETGNAQGLRSKAALETAVIIQLMTDRRVAPDELRDGDVNRGWQGDSYDLAPGETELGSRLWLLRRRTVDEIDVPRLAETYALEALAVLVAQGAAAKVTAKATADPARGRLDLAVGLHRQDGSLITAPKFAILWEGLKP